MHKPQLWVRDRIWRVRDDSRMRRSIGYDDLLLISAVTAWKFGLSGLWLLFHSFGLRFRHTPGRTKPHHTEY